MKRAFRLADLTPTDRYKLMSGLIVPRPIGWVGSRSAEGVANLAPFSFFNMVAGTPPTVLFVPGTTVRIKDTLTNVRATGEFTLSVVTDEVAEAMNATSASFPPAIDEFEAAELTAVRGESVAAPMVQEAVANFECVVMDIYEVADAAAVVFGSVLTAHVSERVLDGTRIDFAELRAIGRLAGPWYTRTHKLFDMERPE